MLSAAPEVRETSWVIIAFPLIIVGIGSIVIAIMAAVDASKYPDWVFAQTGTSKFVWVGLPIVFLFLCGFVGGIMGLIWFTSKRDVVARMAQTGPPPQYGYGPPPQQGYGTPPPPGAGGWTPPTGSPPTGYPPAAPPSAPPPVPPGGPPQ